MSTSATTPTTAAPASEGPTIIHQILVALLAAAFLAVPYLWSTTSREGEAVGNELVGDGLALVTGHPDLIASQQGFGGLPGTLTAGWWESQHDNQRLYRPLSLFTLGIAGAASGEVYVEQRPGATPFPYHLIIVALNVACALLVLGLGWELFRNRTAAFLAAALFAVLPVHGEVLFDVAGVAELLCTAFSLAAWAAWLRAEGKPRELLLCLLFTFLASLSKESAFALPLVFFFTDVGRAGAGGFADGLKRAFARLPALGAVAGVLALSLALRWVMLGGLLPEYLPVNEIDNPLLAAGPLERIANAARVFAASVPIMFGLNPLLPNGLDVTSTAGHFSPDYAAAQIPVLGAFAWQNLVGIGALLLLVLLPIVFFQKCRTRASLVLVMLASMLLTSNLLFPIGAQFGERLLFFPSVALVLFLGVTLARLGKPGLIAGLALSVLGGLWLNASATTWRSQASLWKYAADTAAPDSAKAHFNNGLVYLHDDIPDFAAGEFERATELAPEFSEAWVALGSQYEKKYLPLDAAAAYQTAFEVQVERSRDAEGRLHWIPEAAAEVTSPAGLLFLITRLRLSNPDARDPEGHLTWLDELAGEGYESPTLHERRGDTLLALNRPEEAEAAYQRSLNIAVTSTALRAYSRHLRAAGRDAEALALLQQPVEGFATASERAEVLIARGDAELMEDPAAALRTVDELLADANQLENEQYFRVRFLQAQAVIDMYDSDPGADPERLRDAKEYLMRGIGRYGYRTEEVYLAKRTLVDLLARLHEDDDAVTNIKNVLQYENGPTMRFLLGEVLRRQGALSEAVLEYRQAVTSLDESPGSAALERTRIEARLALLFALTEQGDIEGARSALAQWHAAAGGRERLALWIEATWEAGRGELEAALAAARLLTTEFPAEAAGAQLLASVTRLAELQDATTAAELTELAGLRLGFYDPRGAATAARAGIAKNPAPELLGPLNQVLANALLRENDLEGAAAALRAALALDPPPGVRAPMQKQLAELDNVLAAAASAG